MFIVNIIALGTKGSFVATKKDRQLVPAFKVIATDTAEGDIYCGSLGVALRRENHWLRPSFLQVQQLLFQDRTWRSTLCFDKR